MYCKYCGKEMGDDAVFCPQCGQPTGIDREGEQWQTPNGMQQPDLYQQPYSNQQGGAAPYDSAAGQPAPDGYAIASLVLGIVGLIALPLIGGILAVVFSNISRRNIGPTTMARAGRILGIIGIVFGVVVVAIVIILFVFVGAAMMGFWF